MYTAFCNQQHTPLVGQQIQRPGPHQPPFLRQPAKQIECCVLLVSEVAPGAGAAAAARRTEAEERAAVNPERRQNRARRKELAKRRKRAPTRGGSGSSTWPAKRMGLLSLPFNSGLTWRERRTSADASRGGTRPRLLLQDTVTGGGGPVPWPNSKPPCLRAFALWPSGSLSSSAPCCLSFSTMLLPAYCESQPYCELGAMGPHIGAPCIALSDWLSHFLLLGDVTPRNFHTRSHRPRTTRLGVSRHHRTSGTEGSSQVPWPTPPPATFVTSKILRSS
jgi:hypothetical protein